jgi:hypothetical protein
MGGGAYTALCFGAAFEDGFSIGWFLFATASLVAVVLGCVYMFRGQGPTTHAVRRRLAGQHQEESQRMRTPEGRARHAYERGDLEFETTLRVETPGYRRTLSDIEESGWRQVERVDHPPIKTTTSTPRYDGGHEVVKTLTQEATFYFVRDDPSPERQGSTPDRD